jgi:glucan-binding YG repeat protein
MTNPFIKRNTSFRIPSTLKNFTEKRKAMLGNTAKNTINVEFDEVEYKSFIENLEKIAKDRIDSQNNDISVQEDKDINIDEKKEIIDTNENTKPIVEETKEVKNKKVKKVKKTEEIIKEEDTNGVEVSLETDETSSISTENSEETSII